MHANACKCLGLRHEIQSPTPRNLSQSPYRPVNASDSVAPDPYILRLSRSSLVWITWALPVAAFSSCRQAAVTNSRSGGPCRKLHKGLSASGEACWMSCRLLRRLL